jgi:group I intron endonuclease
MDLSYKNDIIDDENKRYGEIYKLTCLTTGRCYVGQAVSHILNHKRYRPWGSERRFRCHVSEAYSSKRCQCAYLNNAIRKYGPKDFTVDIIQYCKIADLNHLETKWIEQLNTVAPNGYNLNKGGDTKIPSLISRRRTSKGVYKYYKERKMKRFLSKLTKKLSHNLVQYIKPLNREKKHFGWYIKIDGVKGDFGGVHITLEESKEHAMNFLKELAKHLEDRETPKALATISSGKPE